MLPGRRRRGGGGRTGSRSARPTLRYVLLSAVILLPCFILLFFRPDLLPAIDAASLPPYLQRLLQRSSTGSTASGRRLSHMDKEIFELVRDSAIVEAKGRGGEHSLDGLVGKEGVGGQRNGQHYQHHNDDQQQQQQHHSIAALPYAWWQQELPAGTWPEFRGVKYRGCAQAEEGEAQAAAISQESDETYLLVQLAGGLNQMRAGICDAVVVARLVNAALVLPLLDNSSWWSDGSTFSDVFDSHHFISSLAADVTIVKQLPEQTRGHSLVSRKVPRGSSAEYYQQRVAPLLWKYRVLQLNHFDSRLSDRLSPELQKLRCRVNYEALQFVSPVAQAVRSLQHRLEPTTSAQVEGVGGALSSSARYVAVHLRYEPDMLAFTGCDYGGGEAEAEQFGEIRQRWPTLKQQDPKEQRAKGLCVVSPEEVAIALLAMGLPRSTTIYIASGPLYGGASALLPLKRIFPHVVTKDDLSMPAARSDSRPIATHGMDEGERQLDAAINGGREGNGYRAVMHNEGIGGGWQSKGGRERWKQSRGGDRSRRAGNRGHSTRGGWVEVESRRDGGRAREEEVDGGIVEPGMEHLIGRALLEMVSRVTWRAEEVMNNNDSALTAQHQQQEQQLLLQVEQQGEGQQKEELEHELVQEQQQWQQLPEHQQEEEREEEEVEQEVALGRMGRSLKADRGLGLRNFGEEGDLLGRLRGRATLMAAVDYEMCAYADAFVANNNGNMARLLFGHRRYSSKPLNVQLFGSGVYKLLQRLKASNSSAALERLRDKLLRGPDDPSMRKHKKHKHERKSDNMGYGGRNLLQLDTSDEPLRIPEVQTGEGVVNVEAGCGGGESGRAEGVDSVAKGKERDSDEMWWEAITKEAKELIALSTGMFDTESDAQRWNGRQRSGARMLLSGDDGEEGEDRGRTGSKSSGHGEFYAFPKECLCEI